MRGLCVFWFVGREREGEREEPGEGVSVMPGACSGYVREASEAEAVLGVIDGVVLARSRLAGAA